MIADDSPKPFGAGLEALAGKNAGLEASAGKDTGLEASAGKDAGLEASAGKVGYLNYFTVIETKAYYVILGFRIFRL